MALTTTNIHPLGSWADGTLAAHRTNVAGNALAGASGTVSVVLDGGATLTGTVDVSGLGQGYVTITVSSVAWIVPLCNVIAVGQ